MFDLRVFFLFGWLVGVFLLFFMGFFVVVCVCVCFCFVGGIFVFVYMYVCVFFVFFLSPLSLGE